MKILVIADVESPYYWDFYSEDKLKGIDLIISCGDLAPQYLSFLVTLSHVPVLYVHGNHDGCYKDTPPDGCICIDDRIYVHDGLRIMGLGGSMKYHTGPYQYTEKQMRRRFKKLIPRIFRHKGIDILVTHSPALRINDGEDLPHKGFEVFREIMDRYHPKYFLHGHVHKSYTSKFKRYDEYQGTIIVNGCERCIIEVEQKD